MTDEQQEAADQLREVMRIFNETVRRAVKLGLIVEVAQLHAHHPAGKMPWIDVSAKPM